MEPIISKQFRLVRSGVILDEAANWFNGQVDNVGLYCDGELWLVRIERTFANGTDLEPELWERVSPAKGAAIMDACMLSRQHTFKEVCDALRLPATRNSLLAQ